MGDDPGENYCSILPEYAAVHLRHRTAGGSLGFGIAQRCEGRNGAVACRGNY